MTDTSITTSQTTNEPSTFEKVITWIEQWETVCGVLLFLAFMFVFALCVINFRKKANKISTNQIDALIKVKKYIPPLYVELNNNMEQLRYFIFSHRWKWRIIRSYNLLFKGYVGRQLKQAYKKEINYRISYISKISTVKETIIKTNKVLNEFRNDREAKREELGDLYFVIKNLSYDCIDINEKLLTYCEKIESKNLIVVGSAGNGKTSLLCRATETAIRSQYPCLMISSRDIDNNDTIEYILDKLPLQWKVKNHPCWFLRIINLALLIKRKYLFIIVDAINENDSVNFLNSVGKITDYFSKYSRVKILLSCRSEYFDCRYQKLFKKSDNQPHIFKLNTTDYDERAIHKFFVKYSDYYNVTKSFSENIQNKINKSLLLMRMFFEVNSNRVHDNLEFQNAEIYKQYIDKVASEHPGVDVNRIVAQISSIMIDTDCYDKVELGKLQFSDLEKNAFLSLLDNNLLINKTIKLGEGISERSIEYLYFIFDEFRDFCIARELLIRDEKNNDNKYTGFFSYASKMSVNKQSPLEGVLKYGYYHFKKAKKVELVDSILKLHGDSNIQQANRFLRQDRERTYYFDDFGLTLIFMDGENLIKPEEEYLNNSIKSQIRNHLQFFFFLVNDEIVNEKPDLSKYLEMVLKEKDSTIISDLVSALLKQETNYSDGQKMIDRLYYKINISLERGKHITDNIRQMLILIYSFDKSDWYTLPSGEEIEFSDSELDRVISIVKCTQTKENVENLKKHIKEQREHNKRYSENFRSLLEFMDKHYRKK